jgi:hypothetical protein
MYSKVTLFTTSVMDITPSVSRITLLYDNNYWQRRMIALSPATSDMTRR